ncbi:MAG: GNAT family N-acetyltransferase [Opitutaceae bacterium]
MSRYLRRNPGLSFVAEVDGQIVGYAMAGDDGRRGYLQHVAVDVAYRRRGIAQTLISRCLAALWLVPA